CEDLKKKKERGENSTPSELKQKMIYGVTTGFGALKNNFITDSQTALRLQENLIPSHACGVGPEFDEQTTRAIMLLRANTLASGYCAVTVGITQQLVEMLNRKVYPCIPEQGSVGASGDIAPLAHLALGLIGKGKIKYRGERFANLAELKNLGAQAARLPVRESDASPTLAGEPTALTGLDRIQAEIELSYKDGLALLNGISVMTAVGVLAFADSINLVEWADAIAAVTLESILGSSRAFDEIVFTVYGRRSGSKKLGRAGARTSAARIREMIRGSELINRSDAIHDAYSVRCVPQVHGAVRDALDYVRTTLEDQINTVDDDPIMFSKEEIDRHPPLDSIQPPKDANREVTRAEDWRARAHFEQGNFHGESVAFAMDILAIAASELGSISERRIQMLLDANHNRGLPPCLVSNYPDPVNSGYLIAQYTAAALASENKVLCHPASVDSIPTSANTEDHVSMGTIAARKARKVVENVKNILAIELLCSTEALSYRIDPEKRWQKKNEAGEVESLPKIKGRCGERTGKLYQKLRGKDGIPLLNGQDAVLYELAERAKEFLSDPPSELIGE
ncbi:MAG TPA: aromatic amino acid lyase, partial [Blastocatellia bacterium]|nr:aromatic amino acid lyase [Blastocatellia bacterium]